MKNTSIQWTDHTINFWWGCTEVSRACTHCYARDFARYVGKRLFGQPVEWGAGKPRAERLEKARAEALALHRQAQKRGIRYRVFANSMSDWLDEEVSPEWLAYMLETILLTPSLDWQLLSKRPEAWKARIAAVIQSIEASPEWGNRTTSHPVVALHSWLVGWRIASRPPQNIWLGTTIENQPMADKRGPELLSIPARVHFYSIEPAMESLIFKKARVYCEKGCDYTLITDNPRGHSGNNYLYKDPSRGSCFCPHCGFALRTAAQIDWVILGGESGNARDLPGKPPTIKPMHPQWARDVQKQCQGTDIPFFFKQWGEWVPIDQQDPSIDMPAKMRGHRDPLTTQLWLKAGTEKSGRLLDGKEYSEFPLSPTPEHSSAVQPSSNP